MDAAKLAAEADLVVAVVGLGNTEAEGVDRYNLTLPGCPAARMPLPKTGCPGGPAHDQNALLKGESLEPGGYAASRSHSNGSTLIPPARGGGRCEGSDDAAEPKARARARLCWAGGAIGETVTLLTLPLHRY